MTKNGAPASQADLVGMRLLDGTGTEVPASSAAVFWASNYLVYGCATGSCAKSGPFAENGYSPRYDALPAGSYTVEVDTADGKTVSSDAIQYDGQVVLPVVDSATMDAQWQGTELVLLWTNPESDPDWGMVSQVRVVLYDGAGKDVLYVRPALTVSEVRLPAALLGEAAALGDGTLAEWEVQTRASDGRGMNHARGYSLREAVPVAPQAIYQFRSSTYLQYRTHEDPASNRFQGWASLTKDGVAVEEADVVDVRLLDGTGTTVTPTSTGYWPGNFISYNCSAVPCVQSGPVADRGFLGTFDSLGAGDYTIEVDTADGQTVGHALTYPGQLAVPVVSSSTMDAQWAGTDLSLTWTNPTGAANWGAVSRVYVVLFNTSGDPVVYARVPPNATSLTIPSAVLGAALALGGGPLAGWEVQTRAYAGDMNYARGYSNPRPLAAPPQSVWAVAPSRYLQYREYENAASNRYQGFIPITRDGALIAETDVIDLRLFDPTGAPVPDPASSGFYQGAYMVYACRTAPCILSGPQRESAFWGTFDFLARGTYTVEVDTVDGQTVTGQIDYPGQLVLPVVGSGTMGGQWLGPDLLLQWSNPTTDPAWPDVQQLRVALFDGSGRDVLYVSLSASATEVTIPADVLATARALGDGVVARWEVQTRAYDTVNMNHARGYSARVDLPAPVLPVYQVRPGAYLQYRTYENPTLNRFQGWVAFTKDGAPIAETDMVDVALYDLFGNWIVESSSAFYAGDFLFYNCSVVPPTLSSPIADYGFSGVFDNLEAGDYWVEGETADGQFVGRLISYPGRLEAPVVLGSTMTAQWSGGDLVLGWDNPTGEPNWSSVSRIYAVLADGAGKEILYVYVPPSDNMVTVPANVLQSALPLGDGTLATWRVQTRVNDAANVNYARGYSRVVTLPASP